MIELFGTEKEQKELEREAAERPAAPQSALLWTPTTTVGLTVRLSC